MDAITSHDRPAPSERKELGHERWVSIRPIERRDASALSDFYAHLSLESRRRRFLSCGSRLDRAFVDRLAAAPGIVAVLRERGPDDGAIVAHASVQPDGEGGAELAFAVADRFQGLGIGRRLVGLALRQAQAMGSRRATATLLAENAPMRHLLIDAGTPVVTDRIDAGVEEIVLGLTAV